ncbi:MAG: DNA replication/repair protein RecF [Pseudomonadota bacterium]
MHIANLTLSHFRSHRVSALELDHRPVAIFGPNGAGKTNVLEAISMLSPGRGLRRALPTEMVRHQEALGWKVTAELSTDRLDHTVETWVEGARSRQVLIDGKAAPQSGLANVVRVVWLVPAMDRLWTEGADGRRRFLDRIALGFDPGHANATLAYEKAMRERNRLLKDQVQDANWYRALEAQMAENGALIAAARDRTVTRLNAAQDGAETSFPKADLRIAGPDGQSSATTVPEDLAAALDSGRPTDLRAGRTLAGPHRDDLVAVFAEKNIPARDCSTGEQKALLISLILAAGRALASDLGRPPLILLDEISAHLDESRRRALYEEIHQLGAQAWMTGTGPELFQEMGPRAQFFSVDELEGVSQISPHNLR